MPLPTPTSTENRSEFLDRCMSDNESIMDFPDRDQRFAVCNNIWTQSLDKILEGQ